MPEAADLQNGCSYLELESHVVFLQILLFIKKIRHHCSCTTTIIITDNFISLIHSKTAKAKTSHTCAAAVLSKVTLSDRIYPHFRRIFYLLANTQTTSHQIKIRLRCVCAISRRVWRTHAHQCKTSSADAYTYCLSNSINFFFFSFEYGIEWKMQLKKIYAKYYESSWWSAAIACPNLAMNSIKNLA